MVPPEWAEEVSCKFPLELGASGSCGLICNAGPASRAEGIHSQVLAPYGSTLGLALPSSSVALSIATISAQSVSLNVQVARRGVFVVAQEAIFDVAGLSPQGKCRRR